MVFSKRFPLALPFMGQHLERVWSRVLLALGIVNLAFAAHGAWELSIVVPRLVGASGYPHRSLLGVPNRGAPIFAPLQKWSGACLDKGIRPRGFAASPLVARFIT